MEDLIGKILSDSKTIAVVGLSDKPERASNSVARFMKTMGYRIIPVNPAIREALGEKAYASLSEIPEKIDMVNVFRRPEEVLPIAEEAVKIGAKFFWMQEGAGNDRAREILEAAGIPCVVNRCVMKELLKRDE
ncbi:MAG: CoA-binding protein [Syntrophorhabdaceae bacterium]|nr:CoA-binding protein [Syntrophorhabdaceae bacterium]